MNITRRLRIIYLIAVVALSACSGINGFNFEYELKKTDDAYYGPDKNVAENALTVFIDRAERHETSARNVKDLDYDRVLAIAWLQLASVHEIDGEQAKADQAIGKAIQYFDRNPRFTSDAKYSENKRRSLRELLTQTENYQTPEWKKKRPNK